MYYRLLYFNIKLTVPYSVCCCTEAEPYVDTAHRVLTLVSPNRENKTRVW